MANVLIGFIGRGRIATHEEKERGTASRAGYVRTAYAFEAEGTCPASEIATSLFSSALLQRMQVTKRAPERWLVMGTAQSNWADLIEAVPTDKQNDLLEIFDRVSTGVNQGNMDQDLLNEWQASLSAVFAPLSISCSLVGSCDTRVSQLKVWQALDQAIKPKDHVVMDITHGFRHQPIVTTFMLMLLRWLREIQSVELYYGAFEMKGNLPACPVLKLDLCNELLEVTEAIATYQNTGNYQRLGELLNFGKPFNVDLREVVFAGETNRQARNAAHRLQTALEEPEDIDPISQVLIDHLSEPLQWLAGESLAARMGHKALFAFEHGQYFKAIALLWEAIRIAACDLYKIPNIMEYTSRARAEEKLYDKRSADEQEVLRDVEGLRNSVLHGTHANRELVADALQSPSKFKRIFKAGYHLLDTLLQEIEETTP
jgi:CRISPR-associated Csx2 family protein